MDTLSMVSKYLNGLEDYFDDGDSLEARKLTVGKNLLITYKSMVDFGIDEMRIDLTMLEEMKDIDVMLDFFVEELVWRDEDGNTKYRPIAPSFLDIEDDMERALAMEAYFNPFKNIIVFKKLVDFIGSLPVQLKSTNWGNEGHGVYKKVEGNGAWHAKFEVITLSRRKFTRGFKTKNTKRKLSGKFTSKDILKFDHFLDLRAHQSKHKVKNEE
uniref:Uncharacterized protein n=1 Tax=Tanacetum cinerariifolium TaxID=118510 RepID=A0A699K4F7_TANCI|nr:hypothetical protein [Tanacetum cinerariifolium]